MTASFVMAALFGGCSEERVTEEGNPTERSSVVAQVEEESRLDSFLQEDFERRRQTPVPLSEADRRIMVNELTRAYEEGKLLPASTTVATDKGEEQVTGMKTTTDITSVGLRKNDLIIMINGITPEASMWADLVQIFETASSLTLAYIRGGGVYSQYWQVQ
jgi:predicted metalloprotease with PDZ domain